MKSDALVCKVVWSFKFMCILLPAYKLCNPFFLNICSVWMLAHFIALMAAINHYCSIINQSITCTAALNNKCFVEKISQNCLQKIHFQSPDCFIWIQYVYSLGPGNISLLLYIGIFNLITIPCKILISNTMFDTSWNKLCNVEWIYLWICVLKIKTTTC